jgi:hypothetical protein
MDECPCEEVRFSGADADRGRCMIFQEQWLVVARRSLSARPEFPIGDPRRIASGRHLVGNM